MMGKRGRKGYSDRPSVPVKPHALSRFREHWPSSAYLYDSEIKFLLSDQIVDALGRDDYIIAPGGIYVPISVFGEDGYAVLMQQTVQTVMPLSFCKEVDATRTKRNNE
jgi:hypothetical protein